MGVIIKSFGYYLPTERVTNTELALRFGITEDWILERTGIAERRYLSEGGTSDMIIQAALMCLNIAKIQPSLIDCIIVATMTPDYHCPSTAAVVHNKLGTKNAWGFDIMAACSGYIYALQLANSLINSKAYKNILVCGADKMSSTIDSKDRKTALILGDGAGVSLLQYSEKVNSILDIHCQLDSSNIMDVIMEYGGSKESLSYNNILEDRQFLRFNSKHIFENGVELMCKIISEILKKNKLQYSEVDFIVPHQSNKRMIEELAKRLEIPIDKFLINIEYIGNSSAASIPLAISQAIQSGKLKGNERLLIASIGAGFTFAAGIINL